MNELVSVIMPSFNTASFIGESIQSVLSQTYKEFELIIVDDCSTDNTKDIVASFRDSRIRFFSNEKNSGAAISRNRALKEAKCYCIAFLNSDGIWSPEKLAVQTAFMAKGHLVYSFSKHEEMRAEKNFIVTHLA